MKAFCDEREHLFINKTMKNGMSLLSGRDFGICLWPAVERRFFSTMAVGLVGLSISASAQLVSNLEEVAGITDPIASQRFYSNAFTTGSNAGGYTLDSATVAIAAVQLSPGDLVVGIHAASGSDPGTQLEDLAGADPGAAGNHTFTSAGITLDPNTTYHIQLSSPTSLGGGSQYVIQLAGSNNETSSDGWTIADIGRVSTDSGGSWGDALIGGEVRFSIQATPVPEPHEYAMFVGLGLIGFVAARRRFLPSLT